MRNRTAWIGALVAAGLLVAAVPARGPVTAPSAGQSWAVLVGISDYLNFDDEDGGDLPGAERDARAMRDVLVARYGFPEDNVLLLLNGEATRAAMESALTEWLPARVQAGDKVIFYFAGHGSQIWDESGDEVDGLDETIAPADVDPVDPSMDIVDEELGDWLRALPTSDVFYVHDNCSAATGTRAATPFSRTRALGRDLDGLANRPSAATRSLTSITDNSGYDVGPGEIMELAASQPNQVAVDALFDVGEGVEPFHGGAFTTFLVQELWRASPEATYADVFRNVTSALKRNRFQQDPYLTNSPRRAEPIFSAGSGNAALGGVPVVEADARAVTVGGGAALGLMVGSELRTSEGAQLVVESVERDDARARVLSGSVQAGDRAVLYAQPFPAPVLSVQVAGVDAQTVQGLRQAMGDGIEDAPVRLVDDPDAFTPLALRRSGTEIRVIGTDGFTRHVVEAGMDGTAELAAALRQESGALTLAELDNPGQRFDVTVAMSGGQTEFGLGERVTFEITSQEAGYLTLLDLGTDGGVSVIFPNPFDRDNRIRAGEARSFPSEEMGFEIEAQPPVGRGMVRVFVTPEPMNLGIEDGFRSGGAEVTVEARSALADAVGTTSSGALRLEGWGTAAVVYEIRR